MIITETIFTKLTLAGNWFVQNSCTAFHEDLTNSSVVDTTSNRGGLTDTCDLLFPLRQERLILRKTDRQTDSASRHRWNVAQRHSACCSEVFIQRTDRNGILLQQETKWYGRSCSTCWLKTDGGLTHLPADSSGFLAFFIIFFFRSAAQFLIPQCQQNVVSSSTVLDQSQHGTALTLVKYVATSMTLYFNISTFIQLHTEMPTIRGAFKL